MEELLKFLTQFNQGAGIVGSMLTPTGAIGILLAAIQRIRDRRKAAGENTEDLDKAIEEFIAAVGRLVAENAAYWAIPEKPTEPTPPAPVA